MHPFPLPGFFSHYSGGTSARLRAIAAIAQIDQGTEQEAESGDLDQSFEVTGGVERLQTLIGSATYAGPGGGATTPRPLYTGRKPLRSNPGQKRPDQARFMLYRLKTRGMSLKLSDHYILWADGLDVLQIIL